MTSPTNIGANDLPRSSFFVRVPDPGTDPLAAPYCTFVVNTKWVPAIIGSIEQLLNPWAWDDPVGPTLDLVLGRARTLLDLFCSCGDAGPLPPLQIAPDGRLQYAPDGVDWVDLERHAPVPVSAARPWAGADSLVSNVAPFTGILNAPDGAFLRFS